ncbi:acyl carrier protein [Paenibacillus tianmuensis]|uniref:Acyl carrier protein n=1 Tax=Paenibacillus tianmuensis TaxID=624147 RepID=A0A1G4R3Y8_9BACL|nr:acyl carrier protein [Paenibacillus tianmuensis]SCW51566.1 acyl carrier protein [Paenibacillus tianmuensis]
MVMQTVMKILSEIKESPELLSTLKPETDIVNEVGLDSLQMINFVLAIEDAFDVEIDFDHFQLEHLNSIQAFVAFLESVRADVSNGASGQTA